MRRSRRLSGNWEPPEMTDARGRAVGRMTPMRLVLIVTEVIAIAIGVVAFVGLERLGRGSSATADNSVETVAVCHTTEEGPRTIEVSGSDVQLHLDHGEYPGACAEDFIAGVSGTARAITATPAPTATPGTPTPSPTTAPTPTPTPVPPPPTEAPLLVEPPPEEPILPELEPTVIPEPVPTDTPEPIPTPEPTETPEPTATPTPEGEPTPAPTETSVPEETPTPSSEPTVESTLEPTPASEPTLESTAESAPVTEATETPVS